MSDTILAIDLGTTESCAALYRKGTVDIVPDSDPIPRVELSGGTIYRILCLKSPFECHDKELSLCESLIICRNPFAREYCEKTAKLSKEDIDIIFNSTKFNDN